MRARNHGTVIYEPGGAPLLWRAAAACFLIAAATGALLRFGFVAGLPWGLEAGNVRHAHSHLMSFSWTTPAIMALWLSFFSAPGGSRHRFGVCAASAALILGLLTFPFFLLAGYGKLPLFGTELPLASMLSGVTMISWYLFTVWWVRSGWQRSCTGWRSRIGWRSRTGWRSRIGQRSRTGQHSHTGRQQTGEAVHLLDASLIGLCLSTVGAWGRAALQAVEVGLPGVGDLAVQLFLGAFMHGWLIVATLGLAFASMEATHRETSDDREGTAPSQRREGTRGEERLGVPEPSEAGKSDSPPKRSLAWMALVIGMPGASLAGAIGTVRSLAGPPGELAVTFGALVFTVGLLWYTLRLTRIVVGRRRWEWLPYLAYLTVVVVGLGSLSFPAIAAWGERAGLRIVYLHVLTLGVASAGLIAAARQRWGPTAAPSPWSFGGFTLLLVVGLLSLTSLWPGTSGAEWRLAFAAWTSIPPILVTIKAALPLPSLRSGKDQRFFRL